MEISEIKKELHAAGQYLFANGLAWGNAGNLSARVGEESCLITASGTRMDDLAEADLLLCPLQRDRPNPPGRKPSKELPMHQAVYAARPDVQAVLHSSPFYSTLAACAQVRIPADWFVEAMYYLERVGRVAYHHPGSQALADAVGAQAVEANILLLENHGVLVYDSSVREALVGLHTLEIVCRMLFTARSAQVEMRPLSPQTVSDFLNRSGYRPRRQWGQE